MINKVDLVDNLENNNQINLSRKTIKESVDCILNAITDKLKEGGRIEVRGFGVFTKKSYLRSSARNPKTGETFLGKKTTNIKFRAGKLLKERVNN